MIDPRSGRPADQIAGVTVVAPDAATADVLATAAAVGTPEDALNLLADVEDVHGLIVADDGTVTRSTGWQAGMTPGGETCSP